MHEYSLEIHELLIIVDISGLVVDNLEISLGLHQ